MRDRRQRWRERRFVVVVDLAMMMQKSWRCARQKILEGLRKKEDEAGLEARVRKYAEGAEVMSRMMKSGHLLRFQENEVGPGR